MRFHSSVQTFNFTTFRYSQTNARNKTMIVAAAKAPEPIDFALEAIPSSPRTRFHHSTIPFCRAAQLEERPVSYWLTPFRTETKSDRCSWLSNATKYCIQKVSRASTYFRTRSVMPENGDPRF